MDGPQAISYQDIAAWSLLTGVTPPPFAVRLICRMDDVFHSELAERRRRREGAKGN